MLSVEPGDQVRGLRPIEVGSGREVLPELRPALVLSGRKAVTHRVRGLQSLFRPAPDGGGSILINGFYHCPDCNEILLKHRADGDGCIRCKHPVNWIWLKPGLSLPTEFVGDVSQ